MKIITPVFYSLAFIIIVSSLFSGVFFSVSAVPAEKQLVDMPNTKDAQRETFFSSKMELERLNDLISKDRNNADYFYNRGCLFEQMHETEKAEKDFSRAIEINKGHADALYNRGLIYLKKGKYDLAIKDFSETIKLKPESADAYCNRGNAYLAKGNPKNALMDFNSAIKIAPQDPDLYYNRAVLFLANGDKKKAMQDMREAARLGHDQAKEYLKISGNKL